MSEFCVIIFTYSNIYSFIFFSIVVSIAYNLRTHLFSVRNLVNGEGPQSRQALFQAIENEIESMREMFVVFCDFIDELEESEVSNASIRLFLTDLQNICNSGKDALSTVTILRELINDQSSSGSSQ